MSEATQTETLEETLNHTDFGHIVYENRKALLGVLLAVVVAVTGFVLWKESKKSAALDNSVKVYEFQKSVWAEAKAGKVSDSDLVAKFDALDKSVQTAPIMIPLALEMGKYLAEKGSLKEAEAILAKFEGVKLHPVGAYFVASQKAVIQEKNSNLDGAIKTLEDLSQIKETIMADRTAVELARLYLLKGEKGKAQIQLDHVIATYPNGDEAKVAKLYKAQLAQ